MLALREGLRRIPMAHAEGPSSNLFLLVSMSGGWDQLLALDPRDNTDARFSESEARKPGGTGIHPAYDRVAEAETRALLATTPSGIQRAGGLSFGPVVPATLLRHANEVSILRGVAMDTLTHEVGRRYFMTGKFPRGLAPNGSSIDSVAAAAAGGATLLPNLSVVAESYNEGLPPFANATVVNGATDLQVALRPFGATLDPRGAEALHRFQDGEPTCESVSLDQGGLVTTFREATGRARGIVQADVASLFGFTLPAPSPETRRLYDALAIEKDDDLAGPRGRAAIAAQALCSGLSDAVSVDLAGKLDSHADWDTEHAPILRESLDTLGRLIQVLKDAPHKAGGSVWSRTTMLVYSDFARTPLLNSRNGRDHHLASSALVAGPKIRGNRIIGATSDKLMTPMNIDPNTGATKDDGVRLRPADIHATLLTSMGIALTPIQNQNPNVISALLA